jgi:hypothetical protein
MPKPVKFGTGCTFRILQDTVLLYDKSPAQRDHHQDSQQAAQARHQHDTREFQVITQNHHGWHGHTDPKCDRFTGRACGLNNVILKNGRSRKAKLGRQGPKQSD